MQHRYSVDHMAPAYGADVNRFVQACDVGVEGAYIHVVEIVTLTIAHDCTPEQIAKHPGAIKAAYEKQGSINVKVTRIP